MSSDLEHRYERNCLTVSTLVGTLSYDVDDHPQYLEKSDDQRPECDGTHGFERSSKGVQCWVLRLNIYVRNNRTDGASL